MILTPKYQKIIFSSLLLTGLLGANLAYAGFVTWSIVPCGTTGQPDCTLCHLWQMGSNIINFISFNLAIPVGTVLFVVAGVIFLISGGNEKRLTLAKSIFFNTIIGLVIIFTSWLIVDTVFKTIGSGAFVTAWNVFPTCP